MENEGRGISNGSPTRGVIVNCIVTVAPSRLECDSGPIPAITIPEFRLSCSPSGTQLAIEVTANAITLVCVRKYTLLHLVTVIRRRTVQYPPRTISLSKISGLRIVASPAKCVNGPSTVADRWSRSNT